MPAVAISPLLTVRETAARLGVSDTWVRRHQCELPAVRLGRLLKFDPILLERLTSGKVAASISGKSLGTGEPTVQTQRRYQMGSVHKRGKTKTWFGVYRVDVPQPNGEPVRRQRKIRLGTVSELPSKSAAMKALQQHMTASKPASIQMTFAEAAERWGQIVVPQLRAATASFYLRSLRARILPTFGGVELSKITRYDVELFLSSQGQKYARNTLRELRSTLSVVLGWACKNGWITANPVMGVGLPKGTGSTITRNILEPGQVKAIAAELDEPYATLVLLLAATGLRISEAIGLQWSDLDSGMLRVTRRVYEGRTDDLKTKASQRVLPLPPALLKRLQALPHTGEWVFISANGTPVNASNALRRYVHPVARKLGIPLSGWHDLRHSLATRLNQSGVVSDKTVASILGHSSTRVTQQTYIHPVAETFRKPLNHLAAPLLSRGSASVSSVN